MAAVVDRNEAAAKFGAQVDEQLAQTANRIRAHDLAFGGLVLLALVLSYAAAVILLDKYLNLSDAVRQLSLAGFLALLAAAAYLVVLGPLRKRINPLYAAKRVELTLDDAKNSVTGYVDAQEKGDLNPTVRAALASRAARAAADADVNGAVDHRSLLYLGGVAVALFLALVVLFFAFRPAQFASLLGRAFVPFTSTPIVNRTQLKLVKPEPPEPTITTGQTISVAVSVGGKVPRPDAPDKVRLLVRHNPADPNYEELPMAPGATSRDFELRVPDYLVQNGFWYKVAGGDDETAEYKVTVRSLPMFTGEFAATYEYPKYLRRKSETAHDPVLRGYRGTAVVLVARTNREVRDGLMTIEPGGARVVGTPVPEKPDSLRFELKLSESGRYLLTFNAANGERSADPWPSTIVVEADQAPAVAITKPEAEEPVQLPADGQLAVDGKIGDDFGIDTVTLKMKVVAPVERALPDVPFLNGTSPSFRRKDETFPTNLDYKGSVDLAKLTRDASGRPVKLEANWVVEYWLEATDNCTEPKPNVGSSAHKQVRLTEPKTEPNDRQNLAREKDARKNEEKKHNDEQQKKLDRENRDPKPQKKDGAQQGKSDGKPDNKEGGESQPGNGGKSEDQPKPQDPKRDGSENAPNPNDQPKANEPQKGDNQQGMGGSSEPTAPMGPKEDRPKPNDAKGGMNQKGQSADPNAIDKTADELNNEFDRERQSAGAPKTNPTANDDERADPAKSKPQPPTGDTGDAGKTGQGAEQKPESKQPEAGNPKDAKGEPSKSKAQGETEKGPEPAAPKPDGADPKKDSPAEERGEPAGGSAGDDKETPKKPQSQPKEADGKQDPNSGSTGKGATEKPDQGGKPGEKKEPAAGAAGGAKPPVNEPTRGKEKSPPPKEPAQPNPADGNTDPAKGESAEGSAKPQQAPPAGASKAAPKDDPGAKGTDSDPKGAEGANEPKSEKGTGAADVKPDGANNPPAGGSGGKSADRGRDKPQPKNDKGAGSADKSQPKNEKGGGADQPQPKSEKGSGGSDQPQKKVSEEERKALEQAASDLTSPDEKKRQAARDNLDKAIGKDKREELEKAANDLNSPDKEKRDAARKKLEKMQQDAGGEKGDKPEPNAGATPKGDKPEPKGATPKLDEQQKKDLADAVNDLQNPDPDKKRAARQKLDKAMGQQNRKQLEEALEDQKSADPNRRAAGEQKLKDLKDKLGGKPEPGKEGEPTPQEVDDLMKKAQDLDSTDEKKRQQAEKDLDEKIGAENRKKLQEEIKKKKPEPSKEAEDLKKKLKEWQEGQGRGSDLRGATEDDKKNRAKTAELQLDQFEKNKDWVKNKKGWTEEEYNAFMDGLRKRAEDLRKEAEKGSDRPVAPPPADPKRKDGTINAGGGGRVDPSTGPPGTSGSGGATVAPPGFEDARDKFEKALKKKP